MDSINPLLLPEILSKVLQYVDYRTLKTSRLVSSFWNVQAGRILASSHWVNLNFCNVDEVDEAMLNLASLQQTLATSQDPGNFFGKLSVCGTWFPGEKLHQLLKKYGKYLKTFYYEHGHDQSTEDGSSYCQLLIYRVITKCCPHLEELSLSLSFDFDSEDSEEAILTFPIPSLKFNGSINLKIIKIDIVCEMPKKLQNFLVRIVEGCTNLKQLMISGQEANHHMYDKLAGLHHITNNLNQLVWYVYKKSMDSDCPYSWSNYLSSFRFLNHLKTLSILEMELDLKSFPVLAVMLNSIGPSLKKLELKECVFNVNTSKEFQCDLFKIVIKSLVNLEVLRINDLENGYDDFFSNVDSLDVLPHQNLRRLYLSADTKFDLMEISSVSAVVKSFPNLTRLNLRFGNEKDSCTKGKRMQLVDVVEILAGLKRLEVLSLTSSTNLAPGDLENGYDDLFPNVDRLDALPHQNLRRLFLSADWTFDFMEISSVSAVVKWFPNLTHFNLCFKNSCTKGNRMQLVDVVEILAGLKRLKVLGLTSSTNLAPGDLQNTLRTLKQIPKLERCTLVEIGQFTKCKHKGVKTTHTLRSLRDELKEVQHLSFIRLMNFEFTQKKSILDFAKKNGINLQL